MVKDEADVLESWLHYHASIAGYENLHVIDNLSTDGTEKILGRMVAQYGVHVKLASNYREKGVLITNWMKEVVQEYRLHADDVLLPIDIDEFMVRFVRRCEEEHFGRVAGTVLVGDAVRSYIGHLLAVNDSAVFKTNYLINIVGPEFNSGADPITAARSAVYATGGSKGFLTVSALAVVSKCHRTDVVLPWQYRPWQPYGRQVWSPKPRHRVVPGALPRTLTRASDPQGDKQLVRSWV